MATNEPNKYETLSRLFKALQQERLRIALRDWSYGAHILPQLRTGASDAQFSFELADTLLKHGVENDHELYQALANACPDHFPAINDVHRQFVGEPQLVVAPDMSAVLTGEEKYLLVDPALRRPPPGRVRVFISYRRMDCPGHVGRLQDSLQAQFGPDAAFVDFSSLGAGQVFARRIGEELLDSSVVLFVMGAQWAVRHPYWWWRSRIWDRSDWVRRELLTALALRRPIVPVLVAGAPMPRRSQLPPCLRTLVERQFDELRDASWSDDFSRLAKQIERAAHWRHLH